MAPIRQVFDPKQKPIKDYFSRYVVPAKLSDKSDSPFAAFCVTTPSDTIRISSSSRSGSSTPRKSQSSRSSTAFKEKAGAVSPARDDGVRVEGETVSGTPRSDVLNSATKANDMAENIPQHAPSPKAETYCPRTPPRHNSPGPMFVRTPDHSMGIRRTPVTVKRVSDVCAQAETSNTQGDVATSATPPHDIDDDDRALLALADGENTLPAVDSVEPPEEHVDVHMSLRIESSTPANGTRGILTRSTPEDVASPSSIKSRKRSRSMSEPLEDLAQLDGAARSPKLQRLQCDVLARNSSNIGHKRNESNLTTSSVLSSVGSRTPSPPPTTQGSRVIRSSQSDEDVESEEPLGDDQHEVSNELEDDMSAVDSGSDSDSSLEDITAVLSKHKPPQHHTSEAAPTPNAFTRSTRSQIDPRRTTPASPRPWESISRTPMYKFSLGNLIKQNTRESTAQAEVEKAKAALSATNRLVSDAGEAESAALKSNEDTVQKRLKQEGGEDNERLLQALNRAEVFQGALTWSFFKDGAAPLQAELEPFPTMVGPRKTLGLLDDPVFREQAFLSGIVRDLILTTHGKNQLMGWLWRASLVEPRLQFAQIYQEIFKSHYSRSGYSEIDEEDILLEFLALGARELIGKPTEKIQPVQQSARDHSSKAPQRLLRLVQVLGVWAEILPDQPRIYALGVLLRVAIDDICHRDGASRLALQHTISALIDAVPIESADKLLREMSENLFSALDNPVLQLRLLSIIPATTVRAHALRRRLALAFVLRKKEILHIDYTLTEPDDLLPAIITMFKNDSRLSTSSASVDYRLLGALTSLLDIGIDSGFSSQFPRPASALSSNTAEDEDKEECFPDRAADLKVAEADFNRDIDLLVKPVRALSRSIVDSGTSHLSKTDAKAVVERLLMRLEYAVRTHPRPKKSFLSSGGRSSLGVVGEPVGDKKVMFKWMKKPRVEPDVNEVDVA